MKSRWPTYRVTFEVRDTDQPCEPAVGIPSACSLAPSEPPIVEPGILSSSGRSTVVHGPCGKQDVRSPPSAALQKSGLKAIAKNRPRTYRAAFVKTNGQFASVIVQ